MGVGREPTAGRKPNPLDGRTLRRAEARAHGGNTCGAEHPNRKDGLGNPLRCSRPKGHAARKHKAKTKAGEVWWQSA